jgi:hypothetical protein
MTHIQNPCTTDISFYLAIQLWWVRKIHFNRYSYIISLHRKVKTHIVWLLLLWNLNYYQMKFWLNALNILMDRIFFIHLINQRIIFINLFEIFHILKLVFDQFCMKMLLEPEIKRQIYSLWLSNKNTNGQIEAFLSFDWFEHHRRRRTNICTSNV